MTVVECDRRQTTCSQLCVVASTAQSPRCSCVPGYSLDSDGSRCVADAWALPGTLLVYNEGSQLKAFNLSTLTDAEDLSSRHRSSVVLHRANRRIDAVGI